MKLHGNAPLGPKGRATMVSRVLEEGLTLTEAAAAAGVSVRTAGKWVRRYRAEGEAGLLDRSSTPRLVANATSGDRVQAIAALRKLRLTGPEIAELLQMATSTVSAVLKRIGLGRLSRLTKRIHRLLHGVRAAPLGPREEAAFEGVSRTVAARVGEFVGSDDVLLLEDPQTAGLAPRLKGAGNVVVWRSHFGADRRSEPVRVDLAGGGTVEVRRRCRVLREGLRPRLDADRLVVSLARWDRLKDPVGIIHAFAAGVSDPATRLIVAGPATNAVADDPESREVLREARAAWEALPRAQRARMDVAVLPMVDVDENALIVNALQRRAGVILKKSLREGFGLGVTEGMWKARPVVATRVGGHQDQIEHRRSGLLVDDPSDPAAFAAAINELLDDPAEASALGAEGRERIRGRFLADRHFVAWIAALRAAVDNVSTMGRR